MTGSRIYTQIIGESAKPVHIYYWGDNYYNRSASSGSHHWPKDKGVVWVQLQSGVIECTNTYDGIKRTIVPDGTVAEVQLKREAGGHHLTYFEFDRQYSI